MIFQQKELFYDNANAKGEQLFSLIDKTKYNTRTSEKPAALPFFNMNPFKTITGLKDDRYKDG